MSAITFLLRTVARAAGRIDRRIRRAQCKSRGGHDWKLDSAIEPSPDGVIPYAVRCAHCGDQPSLVNVLPFPPRNP